RSTPAAPGGSRPHPAAAPAPGTRQARRSVVRSSCSPSPPLTRADSIVAGRGDAGHELDPGGCVRAVGVVPAHPDVARARAVPVLKDPPGRHDRQQLPTMGRAIWVNGCATRPAVTPRAQPAAID